jgi:hypothetical protein
LQNVVSHQLLYKGWHKTRYKRSVFLNSSFGTTAKQHNIHIFTKQLHTDDWRNTNTS